MKFRYGYGNCSHCGWDVGVTKQGKAVRHGFIRVRRGTRRTAYPDIPPGKTGHACKGSGQPVNGWVRKNEKGELI